MVIIDRVRGREAQYGMPPIDVTAVPLAPPIGAVFVAWSSPLVIEEWLSRAPATATSADRESYARSVAAVRARGFSIGSEVEVELQLEEVLSRLGLEQATNRLTAALELADLVRIGRQAPATHTAQTSAAVGHLIGPIFDEGGQVVMTLSIFGRAGQIQSDALDDFSIPLLSACRRVTKTVGGAWPEGSGQRTRQSSALFQSA